MFMNKYVLNLSNLLLIANLSCVFEIVTGSEANCEAYDLQLWV